MTSLLREAKLYVTHSFSESKAHNTSTLKACAISTCSPPAYFPSERHLLPIPVASHLGPSAKPSRAITHSSPRTNWDIAQRSCTFPAVTPTVKFSKHHSSHSTAKYPLEGRISKQKQALCTPGPRIHLADLHFPNCRLPSIEQI